MSVEITIHNVETGEITQRALTAKELQARQAEHDLIETMRAAEAEKARLRLSALAKLGLTEEEIAAL